MTTNINNEDQLFPDQSGPKESGGAEAHASKKNTKPEEKPLAAMTDSEKAAWEKAIDEFNDTKNIQPYKRISEKMELLGRMKSSLEVHIANGYSPEKVAEVLKAKFKGHPVLTNVTGRNVRDLIYPKNKKTNSKKTKP
jgi:hypothetical protein